MLAILGDIHGEVAALRYAVLDAAAAGASAVIQVGDFGVYEHLKEPFARASRNFAIPVYFIDGNHEHFPLINPWPKDQLTEWVPNCHYVPRGTVLELDDRRIAFLGGAGSIDREIRLRRGMSWWQEEQINDADEARLKENLAGDYKVDLFVTHCPPQWHITEWFDKPDPMAKTRMFGVPATWRDQSAARIEKWWRELEQPVTYCGHMHRMVRDGDMNILNINELVFV